MKRFSAQDVFVAVNSIRNDFCGLYKAQHPDRPIKMCHIGEAVAASFGFNTYQGMKAAIESNKWPEPGLCLDPYAAPVRFIIRLRDVAPEGVPDALSLMRLYVRAASWVTDTRLILFPFPSMGRGQSISEDERDRIVTAIVSKTDLEDLMWRGRAISYLNSIVSALLWLSATQNDYISAEKIERALTWDGVNDLMSQMSNVLDTVRYGVRPSHQRQELENALDGAKQSFLALEKPFAKAMLRLRVMGNDAVVFASSTEDMLAWCDKFREVCGQGLYSSAYPLFVEESYRRQAEVNRKPDAYTARNVLDRSRIEMVCRLAVNEGQRPPPNSPALMQLLMLEKLLYQIMEDMFRQAFSASPVKDVTSSMVLDALGSARNDGLFRRVSHDNGNAPIIWGGKTIYWADFVSASRLDDNEFEKLHGWLMQCMFFSPSVKETRTDGKSGYDLIADEINRVLHFLAPSKK